MRRALRTSAAVALVALTVAPLARADLEGLRPPPPRAAGPGPGGTFLSVGGLLETAPGARPLAGGYAALGLATDKLFVPRAPQVAARAVPVAATPDAAARGPLVSRALAREVVNAAWRAAGIAASEGRLESIVRRARWSGVLPEARLRYTQWVDDRVSLGGEVGDDTPRAYSSQGTRTAYEARLTWRLDRLLFAEEETAVERMRYEQEVARLRIAGQALDALFAWQRAVIDEREATRADPDSREVLDARVRVSEAEATLDVVTAGFWSARRP